MTACLSSPYFFRGSSSAASGSLWPARIIRTLFDQRAGGVAHLFLEARRRGRAPRGSWRRARSSRCSDRCRAGARRRPGPCRSASRSGRGAASRAPAASPCTTTRERAAREVARDSPSRSSSSALAFAASLPCGRGRIGVAAVGADQPVDHQLEHARRLVPVAPASRSSRRAPRPSAGRSRSSSR